MRIALYLLRKAQQAKEVVLLNDDILREKIIKLREERDCSQAELARRINMNNTALNKVEKGTRKLSSSELSELASVFNVTTDYLLGRTPTPQFTRRDERDVQKTLEEMFNGLSDKNALSYMKNGDQEIDEEDAELLRTSLENAIRMSKILAKKKFTPKKYRKNDD